MTGEEVRDALDDPRSVNSTERLGHFEMSKGWLHLRLALEVLHDIQEPIVDVRLFNELNLDLVEITQSILQAYVRHQTHILSGCTHIQDWLLALW